MRSRLDKPIVALIQARGGSKGVPGKNIRNLLGYPVLAWSIAACKMAESVDRIILSTDSQEIANIAIQYGCEVPFIRPSHLASDTAIDKMVFRHALEWLRLNENLSPELFVQIRPTTPLRNPRLIDSAIAKIIENPDFTGLRSVYEMSESAWKGFEVDTDGTLIPLSEKRVNLFDQSQDLPRQLLPKTYIAQGLVDIVLPQFVEIEGGMYGERVHGFITPDVGEIDTESDFKLLEFRFKEFGFGKEVHDYLRKRYPSAAY